MNREDYLEQMVEQQYNAKEKFSVSFNPKIQQKTHLDSVRIIAKSEMFREQLDRNVKGV